MLHALKKLPHGPEMQNTLSRQLLQTLLEGTLQPGFQTFKSCSHVTSLGHSATWRNIQLYTVEDMLHIHSTVIFR